MWLLYYHVRVQNATPHFNTRVLVYASNTLILIRISSVRLKYITLIHLLH